MTINSIFLNFSIFCVSISAGFFIGNWYKNTEISQNIVPQSIENTSSDIPVITLEKIENGNLYISKNESQVRIKIKDSLFVETNNQFTIPVIDILPMLKTLPAPNGMKFVASKRGTKYWALDTPNAFLLSVKNRIFFATREDAERAGKTAGKKR